MDPQEVVAMLANIQANLETLTTIDDRLSRVEMRLENCNEHKEPDPNCNKGDKGCGLLLSYQRWNKQDLDDQYLKSIRLDVLTFDGRLDPQLFL